MVFTQLLFVDFFSFKAVIQELKEEIRVRQEYLDTANDQIQVDKHQLNPDFSKGGGSFYCYYVCFGTTTFM